MTTPHGFNALGKVYENGTLVFERLLPGPIERVWSYITNGERRAKWFNGGDDMPPVAGTDFTMVFNHTDLSGEVAPDSFAAMREPMPFTVRLLKVDPPHALSFTWPGEDYTGTVTITLEPFAGKILLRLIHENPLIDASVMRFLGGWHTHLMLLEDDLLGRKPHPFWTTYASVAAEYDARSKAHLASVIAVVVRHSYKAPPERVFDAFLTPDMIAKFMMGPEVRDEKIAGIKIDARVGGCFSLKVERNGEILDHIGSYYAIERPQRLSFSWGIAGLSDDSESRVTLSITPNATGCDLILTHEMDIQWADYTDRTKDGWTMMLSKLAGAVS